jgi:hypothetical protein
LAARLLYQPLEKLHVERPVDRLSFLKAACTNRIVLDLGAMDETAYQSKRGRGTWLHEELASVAQLVIGIDNSAAVPPEGLRTGERSMIYRGDVHALGAFLEQHPVEPDVIVAGELIEHLPNPLAFLQSIAGEHRLRGKQLLLTTPNATALHNCLVALAGRESTHPDHLCILSYKTMNTLLLRSGASDWELVPYLARFTEMKERHAGVRRAAVEFCEAIVNVAERMWPLLSFGLIARVTL